MAPNVTFLASLAVLGVMTVFYMVMNANALSIAYSPEDGGLGEHRLAKETTGDRRKAEREITKATVMEKDRLISALRAEMEHVNGVAGCCAVAGSRRAHRTPRGSQH